LPIFSRNFVQGGGGFYRTEPNGNRPAGTWESRAKNAAIRCPFQHSVMRLVSFIVAPIAGAISLASERSGALWRASHVAARTTAVNSTRAFN
jgi:hypothetical protein